MNDNDELFDQLKAADPYADSGAVPPTSTSKDARFQEITMNTDTLTRPTIQPTSPATSRWRNPRLIAPVALSVAAVVVAAALVGSAATAPSAHGLVTEAAMQAATHSSGRLEMVLDIRGVPGDQADFDRFVMVHQFEGDNFDSTMTFEEVGVGENSLRFRYVDGTSFAQVEGGSQFVALTPEEGGLEAFGLEPDTFTPDAVLPIIEQADEFTKSSTEGGAEVYTATLPTGVVLAMPEAALPPGLAMLSGEDNDPATLPEKLDIDVWVEDGQLVRMVVDVNGTGDDMISATITTTFSDLGVPQSIVAPTGEDLVG